jgi:hypothetical protein
MHRDQQGFCRLLRRHAPDYSIMPFSPARRGSCRSATPLYPSPLAGEGQGGGQVAAPARVPCAATPPPPVTLPPPDRENVSKQVQSLQGFSSERLDTVQLTMDIAIGLPGRNLL